MPDFATHLDSLWTRLSAIAGIEITYSRGGDSVVITAIPGRTRTVMLDATESKTSVLSMDFVVRRSDLPFGLPERRDIITFSRDNKPVRAQVITVQGEREYDHSDQYSTLLRIHTKEIPS